MTAPVLFGQMHVAPAISDFLRRYREVKVELLLLDRVVNIVEEGIDIAVRIAHLADSTMIAVPVGHVRRVVCASPALLEAEGTPADPHELAERRCVQFSGTAQGGVWTFFHKGRDLPVKVSGSFSCNQAKAGIRACADGLGFGCFLSYQIEPLVREGRLRTVLEEFEPPAIPVSLVYPEVRLISTRLRVLLDWLKASLGTRPELHRAPGASKVAGARFF
jgi:DNA-binding transcriptional LysR family regulator